jgi:hypothetical protein
MFKRLLLLTCLAHLCAACAIAQSPVIVYPAGVYQVTTPGPTTVTITSTSVTFSWGVTPVPPTPTPPVPVPPAPSPIPILTGHVWALAIYDPDATLPAAQQLALISPTLQASALLKDVDFQSHPKADPIIASWIPHVTTGYPTLLLVQRDVSGKGVLAYSAALPGSEADILSLVNKVRGK